MIWAQNSHIVALDNLSKFPQWLSDAMCRLATGGGHSERALYHDDEEKQRICQLAASSELRNSLAEQGRTLCRDRFDHHQMTAQIRHLYEQIVV